ncbi:unnamed protein product, partial [Pylaiella littoralis]
MPGAVSNTNPAESKHKQHKKGSASSSGRDNMKHIWRTYNDGVALKALCEGVVWAAKDYVNGKWVTKEDCTAGPVCRTVLRDLVKVLPLESAFSENAEAGGGEPHGYKEWCSSLGFSSDGVPPDKLTWQQRVSLTLPSSSDLNQR